MIFPAAGAGYITQSNPSILDFDQSEKYRYLSFYFCFLFFIYFQNACSYAVWCGVSVCVCVCVHIVEKSNIIVPILFIC